MEATVKEFKEPMADSSIVKPAILDIVILSSIDPVALDQACFDLINKSNEHWKREIAKKNRRENRTPYY